jgi:hypothetical protein
MPEYPLPTITTIEEVRRLSREDPHALVAAKDEGRLDLGRIIASQQAERDAAADRARRIRQQLADGASPDAAVSTVDDEIAEHAARVAAAEAEVAIRREALQAARAAQAG